MTPDHLSIDAMDEVKIFFRSGWLWSRWWAVGMSALMSLFFMIAVAFDVFDNDQVAVDADRITLWSMVPLSWLLVGFFVTTAFVRHRAAKLGLPAILADNGGLHFFDWKGKSITLGWDVIDGFQITRWHGADVLRVEGTYTRSNWIVFEVSELSGNFYQTVARLSEAKQRFAR